VETSVAALSYVVGQVVQSSPFLTFNLLSITLTLGVVIALHVGLDSARDSFYERIVRHPSLWCNEGLLTEIYSTTRPRHPTYVDSIKDKELDYWRLRFRCSQGHEQTVDFDPGTARRIIQESEVRRRLDNKPRVRVGAEAERAGGD
jgi:hypothetical protein